MALVSPGIQISINDQSQYVNANVGSVPLVVLATEQDKLYNGAPASGTSKANAGKLLSFSSQRDLVTTMGTPSFQLSAAGSPVNGSEINEYGLLTAYSALGISNQLYAIRADVDLTQLTGTAVRPSSPPANNSYWLDTVNTEFGVYVLNATTGEFTNADPLLISDPALLADDSDFAYSVPTPISAYGSTGSYAMVLVDTNGDPLSTIRLFYKADATSVSLNNTWVQVGSVKWQKSLPVTIGTTVNATIAASSTLVINTQTVTTSATTTVAALASSINSAAIPGVFAHASSAGKLELFVTSAATSNGSVVDGKLIIADGTNTPLSRVGITPGSYYAPYLFYGNYAQAPSGGWFSTDTQPRPSGSIWWKTSATGGGWSPVLKQYNSSTGAWDPHNVPLYQNYSAAIYGLDPTGGGINITHGQVIATFVVPDSTSNCIRFSEQVPDLSLNGTTTATSGTPGGTISGAITISTTALDGSFTAYPITLTGTSAASFVSNILGANIPYITARLNSDGTISIQHLLGGQFQVQTTSGTTMTQAGFVTGSGSGFIVNALNGIVFVSNFTQISDNIEYTAGAPYADPASGTNWYYSNPSEVDIMVNDFGWKGYQNVSSDVRGFNLGNTDDNGVIISPVAPTSNSIGANLKKGDLWLDSGDLENYPALYRNTVDNSANWVAIDNTDHVTSNGIIFADARWAADGTVNPITDSLTPVTDLLVSNFIDQDAPDYRLYPRGTLLFNTRRSGYNVKKFVSNYFNSTSFPILPSVPNAASSLPEQKSAWVSASGLDANGAMLAGSKAQRAIVVNAMQSAVDSNLDVLSSIYQFNLIVAPGYPELIPNLIALNDNRGDTAFIIGDTPMNLAPNLVDITNWVTNSSGTGLASDAGANAYLGLYYPHGMTNDLSGNQIVVPASHAVLRTFLYSDQVSYPWFAPAGVNRGLITNMSNIGYLGTNGQFIHNGVSQGLRDALFSLNINPLTQLPGTGLVVFGQNTRSGSNTARDRINVVRLENYLRTVFNSIANGYLFEPNDSVTRKSISNQIQSTLNNILAHRGIYDYLVICDTSNNTAATISNNQLYVDVAIEPMRDVEFIYIPIAIYNPGSIAALNIQST